MKKLYAKEDRDPLPLDWSKGRILGLPNLKPSTTPVSLRLPDLLLARLKRKAQRQGVPYQAYIRTVLARDVARD
jgi:hypothetical protein